MYRLFALSVLAACFTLSTTGCGGTQENTIIEPTTTQTDEELAAIDEEREAAMDSSALQE